jgi:hypothetical protein
MHVNRPGQFSSSDLSLQSAGPLQYKTSLIIIPLVHMNCGQPCSSVPSSQSL